MHECTSERFDLSAGTSVTAVLYIIISSVIMYKYHKQEKYKSFTDSVIVALYIPQLRLTEIATALDRELCWSYPKLLLTAFHSYCYTLTFWYWSR